jgi:hypothetical protein
MWFSCLLQHVWPHFDLVHFLYANDGHGQIMQYENLGAKKVVPCLVGVIEKKRTSELGFQ